MIVIISSASWWTDCRIGGWWKENIQSGTKLNLAVDLGDMKCTGAYIDSVLDNSLSAHLDLLVGWREVRAAIGQMCYAMLVVLVLICS